MARHKWKHIRRETGPAGAERQAAFRAAALDAMALADVRDQRALRQSEVATRMGIAQGGVSRIERRTDLYLSTLRDYVEALGGELELVASFPDGTEIRIAPMSEATRARA